MTGKDFTGKRFGRLVAVKRIAEFRKHTKYQCQCDCGNETIVFAGGLRSGNTKSCGCLRKDITTKRSTVHGISGTKSYISWYQMLSRCENKNNNDYHNYGGRGITVCDRWLVLKNFYADMGERPEGMTLDRINNNKNYCPENCKWSTRKEQVRNRRNNRNITFNGKTQCLSAWAEELNMDYRTLFHRIKYGWSTERALTEKARRYS